MLCSNREKSWNIFFFSNGSSPSRVSFVFSEDHGYKITLSSKLFFFFLNIDSLEVPTSANFMSCVDDGREIS